MISYDYTLNHQGLNSNVSCSYAQTRPFVFQGLDPGYNLAIQYNVSCASLGGAEVLTNIGAFRQVYSNSTLVYWACQDQIPTASYTIYLSGINFYGPTVGNINCVINPIQSAIYSVMYRSTEGIFTATETNASSTITFSALISNALVGLGELVTDSQNYETNLFAETINSLGLKAFGTEAEQSPQYLRLYEQMIQGIIEYEVCPVNYFIPFLSLIVVSPLR